MGQTNTWTSQRYDRPSLGSHTVQLLADPGKARGCSTNNSVTYSVTDPLVPTTVRQRHAQTVSYKIDYVIVIKNFLNPERHQNPIRGSKVTASLLKGLIWPIGEASAGEGMCLQSAQQACFNYYWIV